jgi:hypothetical protein
LGWYSDGGTCVVGLDIAENHKRLAMVANHEATHQIIAHSTPHGFTMDVLELGRTFRFSDTGTALAEELYAALFTAGRTTHEGAATYCGLIDFEGDELAREVSSLPDFYQDAYAIFESLLCKYQFDALDRYRLARAVSCRAMQTDVLSRWVPDELWVPANLRNYLSQPQCHPDQRLAALVRDLGRLSGEELRRWAGGHLRGKSTLMLTPPVPSPMAGMPFTPMPELRDAQRIARIIAGRVFPDRTDPDFPEFNVLGHGGRAEIVLTAPGITSVRGSTGDLAWASQADLAIVNRNPLDVPFVSRDPNGSQFVPPDSAVVLALRCDFRVAREFGIPLGGLADLLDDIDPEQRLPLCLVGDSSFLPSPADGPLGRSVREWFSPWAKRRPVLGYTGGTFMGLTVYCVLLKEIGAPLLIHHMRAGVNWALILIRSREAMWPMAVHPILISEWNRWSGVIYEQYPLQRETPSGEFFAGGPADVVPVLSFLRAYQGRMVARLRWKEFVVAASHAVYKSVPESLPNRPPGIPFRDSL